MASVSLPMRNVVITLSNRTKNHFYTVASVIGICCVPHIAYLLGIKIAGIASFPLLLSVNGYIASFGIWLFVIITAALLFFGDIGY